MKIMKDIESITVVTMRNSQGHEKILEVKDVQFLTPDYDEGKATMLRMAQLIANKYNIYLQVKTFFPGHAESVESINPQPNPGEKKPAPPKRKRTRPYKETQI